MANTIKIKRGLSTDLNNASLQQGELAMTTDTYNLYVGVGSGNYIKIGGGPKNISDGKTKYSVRTIGSTGESVAYKLGEYAFAEGKYTKASGEGSHAEGDSTTASEWGSHAEGYKTTASGQFSHAEGQSTTASGNCSHVEGQETLASSNCSHAEGYKTTAGGVYSHAEGSNTNASAFASHAEGQSTTASGSASHVQGKYNIEDTGNNYTHIVGNGTNDKRSNAHTLDWNGNAWFAGDVYTGSTSGTNKDEGSVKLAKITEVPTKTSQLTNDSQFVTSTDILSNIVDGKAKGSIRSIYARDETESLLGKYAQAFGYLTTASGDNSHAEGLKTTSSGYVSHAEGNGAIASGTGSHAEGYVAKALGSYSHAEGFLTEASGENQHVQGRWNITDKTSAHIVGNGSDSNKSNAHTLDWSGNAWFAGDVYVKSTSGTNKDSGSKKLATEEYVNSLVGDIETILTTLTTGSGV